MREQLNNAMYPLRAVLEVISRIFALGIACKMLSVAVADLALAWIIRNSMNLNKGA